MHLEMSHIDFFAKDSIQFSACFFDHQEFSKGVDF